jgi:ABC-type Fe3+/spermidine/putrescine transport system ATPase subunit
MAKPRLIKWLPMLEISNLSKTIASTQKVLLADVSLTVAAGQVVAILGASGSGKSSLLKITAGLEPFDAGSVRFDGQDLSSVPSHRRRFALMFQQFALFSHLNVLDNVAFGLIEQGISRAAARAQALAALDDYGMAQAAMQSVTTLSGGEQQRVALARALITQPRLLLLDEPFSALDADLRAAMQTLFSAKITASNIATVLVTHDELEARRMAGSAWRLEAGSLHRVW